MCFNRSSVLVGAARNTVAKSFRRISRRYSSASSTGKSVSSAPSTPAWRAILQNFSIPMRRIGFKYEKIITPVDCACWRISAASFSTSARETPCSSARWLARWITGPSATGSLNGTPSSITSAPASIAPKTTARVVARSGSPQVTNATREGRFGKDRGMLQKFDVNLSAESKMQIDLAVQLQVLPKDSDIFISPPGNVHDHNIRLLQFGHTLDRFDHGVRRLERWNNALGPGQLGASGERLR